MKLEMVCLHNITFHNRELICKAKRLLNLYRDVKAEYTKNELKRKNKNNGNDKAKIKRRSQ